MEMIASAAISFVISAVLLKIFIPILKKAKLGQKILEIGPNWHKSKEGTPTMGGLFFMIGIIIACAIMCITEMKQEGIRLLILVLFALCNGLIGFIDDYVKLFKKRNKGLSALEKMLLQLVLTVAFLGAMSYFGYLSSEITLPIFDINLDLGVFTYIVYLLGIVFFINGANFTDGIDGLAGSVNLVIMVLFLIMGIRSNELVLSVLSSSAIGGLLGFLVFNFHPAKVFMGDTGSLFLGGLVVSLCFAFDCPLVLYILGFAHVFEALSVVLQVASFKLTGKRIFKMAPIHHHFEKCGWSEVKIVGVFSFVTAVLCAVSYAIITL